MFGDRGPMKPRALSPSLRSSTLTHGQEKEQSRNTPRYLVDAIELVTGGRLHCDPCSNAKALVRARTEVRFGGKLEVVPILPLAASSLAASSRRW